MQKSIGDITVHYSSPDSYGDNCIVSVVANIPGEEKSRTLTTLEYESDAAWGRSRAMCEYDMIVNLLQKIAAIHPFA